MGKETQIVRKLADYIKKNLSKGYTMDSLKWALVRQGYNRTEVVGALELATRELAAEAPKVEAQPPRVEPVIEPIQEPVRRGFFSRLFGMD